MKILMLSIRVAVVEAESITEAESGKGTLLCECNFPHSLPIDSGIRSGCFPVDIDRARSIPAAGASITTEVK